LAGNILDDPDRLAAERAAADRDYNDALTRLDSAIQQPPENFPHPPPGPDEHQITALNTAWRLDAPPAPAGFLQRLVAGIVRRAVAPVFDRQQAFNSAVVDHINRNLPVERGTRESAAATLAVLHAHMEQLARFQSLLVMLLQRITPYVDTRDRDVAGLLRGMSGAIDSVAAEMMKRTDALLARDARRELEADELRTQTTDLQTRIAALERAIDVLRPQPREQ
jgi:hypothetical protein